MLALFLGVFAPQLHGTELRSVPCRKREKKKRKGVRVAPGKAAIVAVATKAIALTKVLAVQFGLGGFAAWVQCV